MKDTQSKRDVEPPIQVCLLAQIAVREFEEQVVNGVRGTFRIQLPKTDRANYATHTLGQAFLDKLAFTGKDIYSQLQIQ